MAARRETATTRERATRRERGILGIGRLEEREGD